MLPGARAHLWNRERIDLQATDGAELVRDLVFGGGDAHGAKIAGEADLGLGEWRIGPAELIGAAEAIDEIGNAAEFHPFVIVLVTGKDGVGAEVLEWPFHLRLDERAFGAVGRVVEE